MFDVIFGMEWLTSYDAYIKCKQKRVRSDSGKREIVREQKQGKNFLQAKKLLRQGC